ncbi:MAG TPA: hypothetical protein VLV25_00325 [Steroidobacteraceae bacterium]|nr:hypothetical protein [Steroidobacteraceae bacterium]
MKADRAELPDTWDRHESVTTLGAFRLLTQKLFALLIDPAD